MKDFPRHRLRTGLTVVVSALALAVWPPQGLGQEGDEALKQRFLKEATSQWEKYARLSGELQGVLSASDTDARSLLRKGGRENNELISRTEYKTNGRGTVLKTGFKYNRNGKVEEGEEVFGFNPRYAFELRRKSPESPWVLTNYLERREGTDLGKVASRIKGYLTAINYGVILWGQPLAEMVRKPGFRVGACRKVQRDGEELVEVAFTYSGKDGNRNVNLKGKLLFDPKRYWCWRSGDFQVTGDILSGTNKLRGTQSESAGELPPLSRLWELDADVLTQAGDLSNRKKVRWEVTLSQPTSLPADEEFRLSAFGLPEPAGVVWDKPTPTYVWILAAAGAVAALAFGFRYLARRGQADAPREGVK
jgi:hypothetical protein